MIYELKEGRAMYVTYKELVDDYVMYGFPEETIHECVDNLYNFRSDPIVYPGLVFVVVDLLNLQNVTGEKNRLAIYLTNDLCMIVGVRDANGIIRGMFEHVADYFAEHELDRNISVPSMFLYQCLDYLIKEDRKFLENMEIHMCLLETRILKERVDEAFVNEILSIKKELMYIWNYYEQLIDVADVIRDNEMELLPESVAHKYNWYVQRATRLNETVSHLKEYAIRLQDTHDTMLDYNLNNIMKFFTVITTVFLPLTLIVGWYGMNFEYMPELHWRYGYLAVIIVSMVIVAICIVAFKKYKLL